MCNETFGASYSLGVLAKLSRVLVSFSMHTPEHGILKVLVNLSHELVLVYE